MGGKADVERPHLCPRLVTQREHPASERIIYRLRECYPEKPVLIVGEDDLPAGLVRFATENAGVMVVNQPTPEILGEAIRAAPMAISPDT